MNKFIELEKRFENIMKCIRELPAKQSNDINLPNENKVVSDNQLSKDEFFKLSSSTFKPLIILVVSPKYSLSE